MEIGNLYINEDKIVRVVLERMLVVIYLVNDIIYVRPLGTEGNTASYFIPVKEFEQLKDDIEAKYT